MPDVLTTMHGPTVPERTWVRFLLALSVVAALGLGVMVTALSGYAAPGRYGEPLKFAPPPVDLEYDGSGAEPPPVQDAQDAPDQNTPAQDTPEQNSAAPQGTGQEASAQDAAGQALSAQPDSDMPPSARELSGARPADSKVLERFVAQSNSTAAASSGSADAAAPAAKPIRLFGTVEFRSALKNLPKWERVLGSEEKKSTFAAGKGRMPKNVAARWELLSKGLAGKPLLEQAREVNKFFNQWPYKTDAAVWGVEDYWALPSEFMTRSGDCEDYAISKYYALRELGVPAGKLRIVVLIDSIRNLGHAVLAVYIDDKAYILDNLTNLVLSHQRLTHYAPQYSVNEEYLWRHIRPVDKRTKK